MPSGIFGGGGQTTPATFSQGGNPAAYVPTAQPSADMNYQNLLSAMYNPSISALQGISQLPATQYNPQVQSAVGQIANNPYAAQGEQVTQEAANYGVPTGQTEYSWGQNTLPMMAGQVTGAVPGLQSGANQVLGTAFDPQQALYNQLMQQNQAQSQATLAQSGLAGTPYGANLANQSNTNFNLGWQNNQLGRQTQGLGAAGTAAGQVGGLENTGANLLGQAGNMMTTGLNTMNTIGQWPYQTSVGQANNSLGALGQGISLGNQQFTIPQQLFSDLQSYLGLGQAASGLLDSWQPGVQSEPDGRF